MDLTEARGAGSYGRANGGKHREQLSPWLLAPQSGNMRLGTGCCDKRRMESSVSVTTLSVPQVFNIRFRITLILISFQSCFIRWGLGGCLLLPLSWAEHLKWRRRSSSPTLSQQLCQNTVGLTCRNFASLWVAIDLTYISVLRLHQAGRRKQSYYAIEL